MNKVYGYCRVSTQKQSIERQIRNIKTDYPGAAIVTDEYTGTTMNRSGWDKLNKVIRPGDTIIFDSVSRNSYYKYKREIKERLCNHQITRECFHESKHGKIDSKSKEYKNSVE